MNQELLKNLESLGLNDKESKIYLALLQLGKATAPGLAKASGLKKPTAYVIIEQLITKRFAQKLVTGQKKEYAAVSPEKCLAMAKKKIEDAEKSLPELMALKKSSQEEKISVRYLEGMDGAREAYDKIIKDMKKKPAEKRVIVGFYAKIVKQSEEIEKAADETNEMFRKNQIKRKVITVYNADMVEKYLNAAMVKKHAISVRAIKENFYSSNVSIETYDNYVQIFSQRLEQIIIIEDPDIAEAIKQIFALVWDLTEKNKNEYLGFVSEK